MTPDDHEYIAQFERRLRKLLQSASDDRLCPSCVCRYLLDAVAMIADQVTTESLEKHGLLALVNPINQTSTTKH